MCVCVGVGDYYFKKKIGSGSVVILEAFRLMLFSGYVPSRPVEFQWYAAEEVGLLGSQDIAELYAATGQEVHAQLQIDMCGGVPGTHIKIYSFFCNGIPPRTHNWGRGNSDTQKNEKGEEK